MSDAAALKIVGNSFRRGFNAPDESVSHGDLDIAVHMPHFQWINQANCTVTSTAPEGIWVANVADQTVRGMNVIPAIVAGYETALWAVLDGRILQACFGWTPIAKHIKWRALSGPKVATEFALFGPGPSELGAEVVLTGLSETAGAKSGPDVSELTRYLLAFSTLQYAKPLASRVLEIEQDLIEEADGEKLLSSSLFSLIRFLEINPAIARPSLAVGRGGYLIAKWTGTERRQINIHFLPDGAVQYYVFVPDEEKPERQEFLTGSTTIDSLSKRLRQIQVLGWMSR